MAMSNAAISQQLAFYINQSCPSFLLTTDQVMNQAQAKNCAPAAG
jgi:hypothetical protein